MTSALMSQRFAGLGAASAEKRQKLARFADNHLQHFVYSLTLKARQGVSAIFPDFSHQIGIKLLGRIFPALKLTPCRRTLRLPGKV